MSSESRFDSGADGASEPHTDPTLRAVSDQELPPLWEPRVPELDDRALAQLLAELDGEDEPTRYRRRRSASVTDAVPPPAPRAAPRASEPAPPAAEGADEWPIVPTQQRRHPPAPPTRRRASTQRFGPPPARRRPDHVLPEVSSIGPVIHSSFGDFRPTVRPTRNEQGLTGLAHRSRSRLGSLVFTLTFVAIFLVIVIETLVSLLSGGVGP